MQTDVILCNTEVIRDQQSQKMRNKSTTHIKPIIVPIQLWLYGKPNPEHINIIRKPCTPPLRRQPAAAMKNKNKRRSTICFMCFSYGTILTFVCGVSLVRVSGSEADGWVSYLPHALAKYTTQITLDFNFSPSLHQNRPSGTDLAPDL